MLGQTVFGGTVSAVLARAPAPVALLIDHGLSRAFAVEFGPRRVLVALGGGEQDARVVEFAEQLLRDSAVSLTVLVAASDGATGVPSSRSERLVTAHPKRVELRATPSRARHAALLASASQADLLLIGLDPAWGLSADGLDSEAARLAIGCPASLLVIHGRSSDS